MLARYGIVVHKRLLRVEKIRHVNHGSATDELTRHFDLRPSQTVCHEGSAPLEPGHMGIEAPGGCPLESERETRGEETERVNAADNALLDAMGAMNRPFCPADLPNRTKAAPTGCCIMDATSPGRTP